MPIRPITVNRLCCVLATLLTPVLATAADIDVYLIGGQSNATGQGYLKNLPADYRMETRVEIFHSGGHLHSGEAPLVWHPLRQASESADRFGAEIGFAERFQQRFPKSRIAIIKHAWSGTNLHTQWNPATPGKQYKIFIETVTAGMQALEQRGDNAVIRGMLWQQGEADCKTLETAQAYGENLVELIRSIRRDVQAPEMWFAYGHVFPAADYSRNNSPKAILRQQQNQVAEDSGHPLATAGAVVVKTDKLNLRRDDPDTPYPNDVVHFGTTGTLQLGHRFADAIADAIERGSAP